LDERNIRVNCIVPDLIGTLNIVSFPFSGMLVLSDKMHCKYAKSSTFIKKSLSVAAQKGTAISSLSL
jgi:hypothetical protein